MSDCLNCKYYKMYSFKYGSCSKRVPTYYNRSYLIFCPYYETDYGFIVFCIFFCFLFAVILWYIINFLIVLIMG